MHPLVTVLLPVYNGEAYLHNAIESIINQHFGDFELLIIDDGSTDSSPQIIESFKDSRIRFLKNNERIKLSGALNRGIQEASGKYIARMDADDISFPNRLGSQVEFLDTHSGIGLCGSWVDKFGKGTPTINKYPSSHEEIRAYALFDCPFAHPTVMFRRELFLNHNLVYDGSYYPTEDYELWARAIEFFSVTNLPKVLLKYRVHAGSMTGADWQDMDVQAARVAEKQLEKLGFDVSAEQLRFHRNIGRGSSCRVGSLEELQQGEAWLLNLKEKNKEVRRYQKNAFHEILALIWFRLCMNNTWLGFDVFNSFNRSPLSRNSKTKLQDMATLVASIIKHKAAGSEKQK